MKYLAGIITGISMVIAYAACAVGVRKDDENEKLKAELKENEDRYSDYYINRSSLKCLAKIVQQNKEYIEHQAELFDDFDPLIGIKIAEEICREEEKEGS